MTTTRRSPRLAQQARTGGNSRTLVSAPNQTAPPAATVAAACSATAFFLRVRRILVRRIGPAQHELGPFPPVAQPMPCAPQRAPQRPFACLPPALGELGAHEGSRPVRGRRAVRLGIARRHERLERPLGRGVQPTLGSRMRPLRDPSATPRAPRARPARATPGSSCAHAPACGPRSARRSRAARHPPAAARLDTAASVARSGSAAAPPAILSVPHPSASALSVSPQRQPSASAASATPSPRGQLSTSMLHRPST
jgi:hypothetical protein